MSDLTIPFSNLYDLRYVDDPLIPADPDEAASIYEVINSSGTSGNNQYATGTSAGDDTECAAIPWYMPGTEPPPEQELPPPATDPLSVLASGAYLDDNALQKIIIQLPYSLQALDFSALRALVQDPAALQSVLRPDGSVDEFNLSTFQRNLNGGGGGGVGDRERMSRFDSYHGGDMGSSGPPVFLPPGDLNGPNSRRSRFRDAGPEPMMIDNYGGGGYGPSGQPYDFDYDPYGPPRNGRYDDRPPLDWNPDYGDAYLPPRAEPLPLMGGAPRRGAPAQSRFTSTKAATPCRFFNTAKGCQFGDKCSFGHFLPPSDLPPAGPMDVYMPPDAGPHQDRSSRWGGGGPSAGPGGPGRRFSGPGDRHAGAGGPGPAMGPGMGGRSGPGSRLHSQFSAPPSAAPHLTTVPIPMAGTQLLEGMPPIGMDPVGAGPSKRAKRFN